MIIQTIAPSRAIKQAINALLKAGAITSAYKTPYVKYYSLDDQRKIHSSNIQLIHLIISPQREKSGPKILDQLLKERQPSDL